MASASGGAMNSSVSNPSSYVLSQISFQVTSLAKKPCDYELISKDIRQLVDRYGGQAEAHLLRCLFAAVDIGGDSKNHNRELQVKLLAQECNRVMVKPNFSTLISYALLYPDTKMKPSVHLFQQLVQTLNLSSAQLVAFAIALWKSGDAEMESLASRFLRSSLADVLSVYSKPGGDSGSDVRLQDLAVEIIHEILMFILGHAEDLTGVPKAHLAAFIEALQREYPRDRVPVVLLHWLYPEDQQSRLEPGPFSRPPPSDGSQIAHIILEVGYGAMASVASAENFLRQVCGNELKVDIVAMCLGVMARTHTGLMEGAHFQHISDGLPGWEKDRPDPNTWNLDIFVDTVMAISKNMDWAEVMARLDYPEFGIQDVRGLHMILAAYDRGTNRSLFPVGAFLRPWSNTTGQLTLLTQALSPGSDFNFTNFPLRKAAYEHLKVHPDETDSSVMCWTCLEVMQALFRLSESGHYEAIASLFAAPSKNCPDVLLLSMLQARPVQWCPLQKELFVTLVPMFFNKHENSSVVLNYTWNAQAPGNSIHTLMMQCMAEWYQRGDKFDQMRLSRILDVAQELKGLLMLVNSNDMPMPFVVDLAALASRRGYLKLDKWLHDRMRDQQEVFVQGCLSYLRNRTSLHGPMNVSAAVDRPGALPLETITTMLACIQSYTAMNPETQDHLHLLLKSFGPIPPKPRSVATAPPGGVSRNVMPQPKTPFDAMPPAVPLPGQVPVQTPVPMPPQMPMPAQPMMHQGVDVVDKGMPPMGGGFPGAPGMGNSAGFGQAGGSLGSLMTGSGGARPNATAAATVGASSGMGHQQGNDIVRKPPLPGIETQFSGEVEEEANDNFKRLYNRVLTIDNVLDMLRQYKDSPDAKQKDVFQCMLRNLFEEYKFFASYPDKELQITGLLFGGLIEHNLVTYMYLGLALRYVLESLRKPTNHKLYAFGLACLDRFKHRLKEYPQYCGHVASIGHFNEFPKVIADYVTFGRDAKDPPSEQPFRQALPPFQLHMNDPMAHLQSGSVDALSSGTPGPAVPPTPTSSSGATTASTAVASVLREYRDNSSAPSVANATNIDTLVTGMESDVEVPPESVRDRVSFICNNLSSSNLVQKLEAFKEVVMSEHWPWVAQHLVMKRVTIEQNYHELYVTFIFAAKQPKLVDLVMTETYRNIKVLLVSDKESAGFSDRLLLKSLGHWLGLLTIGRNHPILFKDLCVKDLLIEANRRGQQDLLFVVPFITKLLEACATSKVFRPPCPWTMAIVGVLCELHNLPELKLNLKFAVEVLCKHLSIEMKDVKTYDVLKDDRPIKEQLTTAKEKTLPGGDQVACPSARFSYSEVNISSFQLMAQHVIAAEDMPLFVSHPHLKAVVKPAVTTAVSELMPPVVERSIKIAIATTEQIVRKDFALDSDEQQLRRAAQNMVRNLTAGMVMITCREPLHVSINSHFKQAICTELNIRNLNHHQDSQRIAIEAAANQVATDNVEVACAFIQKTAVEKVVPEMDKRIAEDLDIRHQQRMAGRRYYNESVYSYQLEKMPEAIRLKLGTTDTNHMAVYEEFSRCLPGFLPTEATDEFAQLMEKCAGEVESHTRAMAANGQQHVMVYVSILTSLGNTIRQIAGNRDNTAALMLLQKGVDGFLEGMHQIPHDPDLVAHFQNAHLAVFHALQDSRAFGQQWTMKNATRIWHEARDEIKYHMESVEVLVRGQLIIIRDLDTYVTKAMDSGNYQAIVFALNFTRLFFIELKHENLLAEAEVSNILAAFNQLVNSRPAEGHAALINHIRAMLGTLCSQGQMMSSSSGGDAGDEGMMPGNVPGQQEVVDKPSGTANPSSSSLPSMDSTDPALRKSEDPPGMSDKVEYLLTEWVRLHHQANFPVKDMDRMHEAYLQRLRSSNMLKSDDTVTRFFRISTELCVELCYRNLQGDLGQASLLSRAKCYHTMDAFVKLAIVFVKHAGDPANVTSCMSLLSKILQTVAWVLAKDHETRGTDFHQLPYHRFFSMLLLELSMTTVFFENVSVPVMQTFCTVFHSLRPQRVPGFAYGWLELISHRVMLSKLLGASNQKGWQMFQLLLLDMMRFMAPFLRNAELPKPLQQLYKGLLRVLLVLLHDFPEFLCNFHTVFCDVVPPNCIQMRNLILSAFPRNMRLPDPFTPNLKVDQLNDINSPPQMLSNNFVSLTQPLKQGLENYLKTGTPVSFHAELANSLQQTSSDDLFMRYNVPLLNASVLFIGSQAVSFLTSKNMAVSTQTVANSPHVAVLQYLTTSLDTEGRYLLLNSIANQLRYPNSHTHYFSCVLLHLFEEASCEAVQEQITRVLLERLIVNRPHPWGLLITFIELIKNPRYNFWTHQFVHCAPEIEKLFESVARSCTQAKGNVREMVEVHD